MTLLDVLRQAEHVVPPSVIGAADFANGKRFDVRQFRNGKLVVVDLQTNNRYKANTEQAAWRHIRYLAGITARTERSQDAPRTYV